MIQANTQIKPQSGGALRIVWHRTAQQHLLWGVTLPKIQYRSMTMVKSSMTMCVLYNTVMANYGPHLHQTFQLCFRSIVFYRNRMACNLVFLPGGEISNERGTKTEKVTNYNWHAPMVTHPISSFVDITLGRSQFLIWHAQRMIMFVKHVNCYIDI